MDRNPVEHRKTKHIDIRHHFIRERISDGTIELCFIGTTEMTADILTKALHKPTFQRLRNFLGLKKSCSSC